jgi:hypothetical protein
VTWYRSRPERVEAIRWLGEENCEEVFAFLGMDHSNDEMDHTVIHLDGGDAAWGDWIIRWTGTDLYYDYEPLSDEDFKADWEPEES